MQVKERNNSWLFTYIFIFLLKLDLSNTSLNYVYESILNAIHQPIYMCMRLIFTVFFTKDEKLDIFYLRNMIWKRPAQVINTLKITYTHGSTFYHWILQAPPSQLEHWCDSADRWTILLQETAERIFCIVLTFLDPNPQNNGTGSGELFKTWYHWSGCS